MEALIEQMKVVIATTFSFYLKAHNFHWNVTGPSFSEYHKFLGDVYSQAHDDVDGYAERTRALGAFVPGSLVRFAELTRIQDELNVPPSLLMIARLEVDNETLLTELNYAHDLADANGALGLVNYIEDRIDYHTKLGWMLRSFNS